MGVQCRFLLVLMLLPLPVVLALTLPLCFAVLCVCCSPKEESELTMCTDVDRNDKSRICEPGSVRVLGRRQIEMYSR